MSDQTLLLVSGLTPGLSSSRTLNQLKQILPKGATAHSADLFDLVRRACDSGGAGAEGLAEALAAEMDARALTEAIIVAGGVSATAALRLAALRPELVRHLVLCAPFGYAQPLSSAWSRRETVAGTIRDLYLGDEAASAAALEMLCGTSSLVPPGQSTQYRESARDQKVGDGVSTLADWMQDGSLSPMEAPEGDRVRRSKVPVSLVWGRDDRVTGLDAAFYLNRRLRDVQLRIFGDLGHLVLEQGGERVARHIGAVVAQILAGDNTDVGPAEPSVAKVGSDA